MAEPTANQRAQLTAVLSKLPNSAAFKFAEAAGVFAPLSFLFDASAAPADSPFESHVGRISQHSLPSVWKWLSDDLAANAANDVVRLYAMTSIGAGGRPDELQAAVDSVREEAGASAADRRRDVEERARVRFGDDRRAVGDAAMLLRLWSVWGDVECLIACAAQSQSSLLDTAYDLIQERAPQAPEIAGALAAATIGLMRDPVEGVDFVFSLVRRRDQHRTDQTHYAAALNAIAARVAGSGARQLESLGTPPQDLLDPARARAAALRGLRAKLEGRVADGWMRQFSGQVAISSKTLAERCASYAEDICRVVGWPEGEGEISMESCITRAGFLVDAEEVAEVLRFDEPRRQALARLRSFIEESGVGDVEDGLVRLAERSVESAEDWLGSFEILVEMLIDARTARGWSRRGRKIIGRPSFEEAVFEPLEPLLVDQPQWPVRRGQMSRDALEAAWTHLASERLSEERDAAAKAYRQAIDEDRSAARRAVKEFRELFARELRAEVDQGWRPETNVASAHVDLEAQLVDVAALLSCSVRIASSLAAWPGTIKHVDVEVVSAVRSLHEKISGSWPEVGPALLLWVMSRLERPWHILRILERIARARNDTLIEATEFCSIGDVLIDIAEREAEVFRLTVGERFEARPAIAALERFAGVASGMTEEFEIRKNGAWGRRLYALKKRAARDLEAVCEAAVDAVETLTPRRLSSNGQWAADTRNPLEPELLGGAVELARFLRDSKVLDQRAAFAGARSKAMVFVESRLETQIDALLKDAHAEQQRDAALAQLDALAKIVAAFEGDEAGQIVRRRAAAA